MMRRGEADRDSGCASGGAREQEVRDVGAGDQEEKSDGTEKRPKDRSRIANEPLLQRSHVRGHVRVVARLVLGALRGELLQLGGRLLDGDVRLEERERAKAAAGLGPLRITEARRET